MENSPPSSDISDLPSLNERDISHPPTKTISSTSHPPIPPYLEFLTSCRCSWFLSVDVIVTYRNIMAGIEPIGTKPYKNGDVILVPGSVFVRLQFLIVFDNRRAEPFLNLNTTEPTN